MGTPGPAEIVEAFIAAIEALDMDLALTMVHDDIEYDNVPMGKVFGPEGVRTFLAPFMEGAKEVQLATHRRAAEGNLVFTERTDRFVLPDGTVEVPVAGFFEIRDGRISLWRDYFDMGPLNQSSASAL